VFYVFRSDIHRVTLLYIIIIIIIKQIYKAQYRLGATSALCRQK